MILTLRKRLSNVQNDYDSLSKSIKLQSSGTNTLNGRLSREKIKNDKKGIGFSERNSNSKSGSTIFVRALVNMSQDIIPKSEEFSKGSTSKMATSSKRWICHYCGKQGHIRPFCYKLHWFTKIGPNIRNINYKRSFPNARAPWKSVWRIKETRTKRSAM